jgi:flagellar biosynthetic protein FliQ
MGVQEAIDLGQAALWMMILVAAPVLLTGFVVSLVIGLLQALTQVQESTVSFFPKLVLMLIALSVALPWLISMMVEYSRNLYLGIPDLL